MAHRCSPRIPETGKAPAPAVDTVAHCVGPPEGRPVLGALKASLLPWESGVRVRSPGDVPMLRELRTQGPLGPRKVPESAHAAAPGLEAP